MPDAWEVEFGLDPLANDAGADPDGDVVTNAQEYNGGVDSTNPQVHNAVLTDPEYFTRDTDGDGLSDWAETNVYHTNISTNDTVGDGLGDWYRVTYGLINPDGTTTGHPEWAASADADGDGVSNADEQAAGTNANDANNLTVNLFATHNITRVQNYGCPPNCDPPPQVFDTRSNVSVSFPPGSRAYLVQGTSATNILIQERVVLSAGTLTASYNGYGNSKVAVTNHLDAAPTEDIYCYVPAIDVTDFIASLPDCGDGKRCFSASLQATPTVQTQPCPPCQHRDANGDCVDDALPPCTHRIPGSSCWESDCLPGTHCENGVCVDDPPPQPCPPNCPPPPTNGGGGDGNGGGGRWGGGGGGPWVWIPDRGGGGPGGPVQPGQAECSYSPGKVYASSPVWLVVVTNVTASVTIRIDNNNDRQLNADDDAVKSEQPFRFWVNNDNDESDGDKPSGNDSANDKIDCTRDLEDFAMMQITVDASTLDLIENHGYKVALVSTGPQVNVFRVTEEGHANLKYLTDPTYAASLVNVPAVDLNNMFPAGWGLGATQYFIFEGKSAGGGELKVEIRGPNGNAVTNDAAKVEIREVSKLYKRAEAWM
jgi:hypothetical protein